MLTIEWEKVDKIYFSFLAILVLMSILVIFSFRGIFSLFLNSADVDSNSLPMESKVQTEKLNEVYNWIYTKNPSKLQVTD